jgi:hypothetical protein
MSRDASSISDCERAISPNEYPRLASSEAIANPIPRLAPVTTATLSFIIIIQNELKNNVIIIKIFTNYVFKVLLYNNSKSKRVQYNSNIKVFPVIENTN